MMSSEDRILLERLADGDRRAFQALYDRYVRMIYAVCLRMTGNYEDAEEAVQDTFMNLVRQGDGMRKLENLRAWLMRVAACRSTDLVRRRAHHEKVGSQADLGEEDNSIIALSFLASSAPSAHDVMAQDELVEHLRDLTKKLPQRQFLAFTLRHFQGMSISEVAEVMTCSEGAVKAHLHLALKRMRELALAEGLLDAPSVKRGKAQS